MRIKNDLKRKMLRKQYMLDLPDYINHDFEVPDRYSKIPLCSKGILSKVIIKNEIN